MCSNGRKKERKKEKRKRIRGHNKDNDLKHIYKKVQKWLKNQDFMVLRWPAQSAELNPIEHI